ncbi:transcription-associated protein 1 [Rhodotorula toruloides]
MAGPPSTSSAGRRQSAGPKATPGAFGAGSPLEGQSFETIADKLKDPSVDYKTKTNLATELRDAIDMYQENLNLGKLFDVLLPAFTNILRTGKPAFVSTSGEHKLRNLLIQILHYNAVSCMKVIIDLHGTYSRPPPPSSAQPANAEPTPDPTVSQIEASVDEFLEIVADLFKNMGSVVEETFQADSLAGGSGSGGCAEPVIGWTTFQSIEVVLTASSNMTLRVFSATDGLSPRVFKGHTKRVTGLAILQSASPSGPHKGRKVPSSSLGGMIKLWDVLTAIATTTWMLSQRVSTMSLIKIGDEDEQDVRRSKFVLAAHVDGSISAVDLSLQPVSGVHPAATIFRALSTLSIDAMSTLSLYASDTLVVARKDDLYRKCLRIAKRIAFDIMSKGYKSTEICQGFLLLYNWNQPAERFEEERTWSASSSTASSESGLVNDLNLHRKTIAQLAPNVGKEIKVLYERKFLNCKQAWIYSFIID